MQPGGGDGTMKPPVFDYERPPTLRAALEALSRHGEQGQAAGRRPKPHSDAQPAADFAGRLIDVSRLTELQYIVEEYGQLRIGALTTHNTILRSPIVAAELSDHDRGVCARRQSFDPQPWHARRQSLPQRSGVRDAADRHAARRDDDRAQRALYAHDCRREIFQGAFRHRSCRRRDADRNPRSAAAARSRLRLP